MECGVRYKEAALHGTFLKIPILFLLVQSVTRGSLTSFFFASCVFITNRV